MVVNDVLSNLAPVEHLPLEWCACPLTREHVPRLPVNKHVLCLAYQLGVAFKELSWTARDVLPMVDNVLHDFIVVCAWLLSRQQCEVKCLRAAFK